MLDEIVTGEENSEAAAQETTGVEVPPEGVPPVETTPAAGGDQEQSVEGLKAAAIAERTKRQAAESELEELRSAGEFQAPVVPQAQASLYAQVAKQLGYDPEYLEPEQQGQVYEGMMHVMLGRQTENAFATNHPDYAQVVGVVRNGVFLPAGPLKRVYKRNPAIKQAINSLGNSVHTKMLAYELAISDPEYQAELKKAGMSAEQIRAAEAQAKINAANKPLSVSAAVGGGVLDKANQIRNESPEEFEARLEKVKSQAN